MNTSQNNILFKTKYLLIIVLFSLCTFSLQAQKKVRVSATGVWVLSQEITLEQAKEKALNEAKKEALRKAGVPENVYAVSLLSLGNNGDQFLNISSELGRIAIDGRLRILEQTITNSLSTDDDMVICTANIEAEVLLDETEADPTFVFDVKGIKTEAYREKELLTFSITPNQNCYFRIFWFTASLNGKGDLIYPYADYHYDMLFPAQKKCFFPPEEPGFLKSVPIDYEIYLPEKQKMEQNIILIVALKEQIPYVGEVTYEKVMQWLLKIKRNKKTEAWYPILLVK